MRIIKNRYTLLGIVLATLGIALSLLSQFVLDSPPLTALGMASFIIGAICIALAGTRPAVSPEVSAVLLETGIENASAIVEELGLSSGAIYLPSSLAGEGGYAVIPIGSGDDGLEIRGNVSRRLITRYGSRDGDIGVMVATAGAACLRMLKEKPGPAPSEIEAAITSMLAGVLDVADGVRVNVSGDRVAVEITHPRLKHRNIRFYKCVGSPLASIAAGFVCEAMDTPLVVESERREKGRAVIEMRLLR